MSQGGGGRTEHSSRVNFPEISLKNAGMREFSGHICEKRQFHEALPSQAGKMFPSIEGNTFSTQKNV